MPIRKYKPTTPGRRGSSVADFVEITRSHAREVPAQAAPQDRWPQQHRTHHDPPHRWRSQASVPRHRLQAQRQGRRRRQGRAHRVRPEPHGAHRAPAFRGRHEALHHRAEQAQPGRRRRVGSRCRHQARQQPAAQEHPGRYRHPRDRAEAGRRRQDGAFRRCLGATRRRRTAPTPSCVSPRARSATSTCAAAPRSARSATPSSRTSTGARPAACAGRASARPSVVSR